MTVQPVCKKFWDKALDPNSYQFDNRRLANYLSLNFESFKKKKWMNTSPLLAQIYPDFNELDRTKLFQLVKVWASFSHLDFQEYFRDGALRLIEPIVFRLSDVEVGQLSGLISPLKIDHSGVVRATAARVELAFQAKMNAATLKSKL